MKYLLRTLAALIVVIAWTGESSAQGWPNRPIRMVVPYTPGTGACTAPAGYDYCVTHVRWTMAGTMPTGKSFTVGMTVRVK
jgi:hypothetical protein